MLVLNSGGGLNLYTERRVGPIERTDEAGGTIDGFGGDAYASNGIGSANPDLYFIFVEGDVEEFYIERDSLWGSHGTSDNTIIEQEKKVLKFLPTPFHSSKLFYLLSRLDYSI